MSYADKGYWPGWGLLRASDAVEDLDPHRTVTYLDQGVPHCYLGHPECYDAHTAERLSDEVDWSHDDPS